ncbi:MAG: TVP38/TMEM64 family protein [Granulosicoccus sp.]|nr:TVP38/TMEM64 family protein [Granulosicoccus sp.]
MKLHWRLTLGFSALVLILLLWGQLPLAEWIERFRVWILDLGVAGVVAFVAMYVGVTLVLGPTSALALSAGLAYGFWGFPLVVVSTTLAASVAFLIGRYLAHERVTTWIQRNQRLSSVHAAFSAQGWRVILLLRLCPLIPYSMQNYLFSVMHIRFVPYVLATLIGIMPGTALVVYIGSLGQAVGTAGTGQLMIVIAGLVAAVVLVWIASRRARARLADRAGGR